MKISCYQSKNPFKTSAFSLFKSICSYAVLIVVFASTESKAETASQSEVNNVATNWVWYVTEMSENWSGSSSPQKIRMEKIYYNRMELGYYFEIQPNGYIVVPILKELPPIICYSEENIINWNDIGGISLLVKQRIYRDLQLYIKLYGNLNSKQPSDGEVCFGRKAEKQWKLYSMDPIAFKGYISNQQRTKWPKMGYLLLSRWHQGAPFNNYCPVGFGGNRSSVGCVGIACAQILRYNQWPENGQNNCILNWDGDNSCEGEDPTSGFNFALEFNDIYSWNDMPDHCSGGCSTEQERALAELCYEVAGSLPTDFGTCGSSSSADLARTALPQHFKYQSNMVKEFRSNYVPETWFELIKIDLNLGIPMLYRIEYEQGKGHCIVCDGWRVAEGDLDQYHVNYGWDNGAHTDWFVVDNIYHTFDPDLEYLIRNIKPDIPNTQTPTSTRTPPPSQTSTPIASPQRTNTPTTTPSNTPVTPMATPARTFTPKPSRTPAPTRTPTPNTSGPCPADSVLSSCSSGNAWSMKPISSNIVFMGECISPANDEDYFYFWAEDNSTISLHAEPAPSSAVSCQMALQLTNCIPVPGCTPVYQGSEVDINYDLFETGMYVVKIRGNGPSTGFYNFEKDCINDIDEVSPSYIGISSSSDETYEFIQYPGDIDWYYFHGGTQKRFWFKVYNKNNLTYNDDLHADWPDVKMQIAIYSSPAQTTPLAVSNDNEDLSTSNAELEWIPPYNADFFVKIKGYGSNSGYYMLKYKYYDLSEPTSTPEPSSPTATPHTPIPTNTPPPEVYCPCQ